MAAGVTQGLLTRKGLLLIKREAVAGVDALPVASLDAIEGFEPEYSIDPNVLERDILTPDLSPVPHVIGRKVASLSFSVEMKSNGAFTGDVVADQTKLQRLMRGCGYAISAVNPKATGFTTDFATNNNLTMPVTVGDDHRLVTGDGPVQAFLNGGTLPTGLAEDVDYWVIRIDKNDIQLATSLSNALAGTEIVLSVADADGTLAGVGLIPMSHIDFDPGNSALQPSDLKFYRGYEEGQSPYTENSFTAPILYTITVTTGGASGAAQIQITGNNDLVDDTTPPVAAFTVTSATQFEIAGTDGSNLWGTMIWTGDLVQNDVYRILVTPIGTVLSPISEDFDCYTLKFYEDGLLYTLLGGQGTFTVDATAGNFGVLEFTFTGQYVAPADAALPTGAVFETTLPQQCELGLLTWGSNVDLVVEQWTFDQANNVVPRPDINKTDGFQGVRITDRTPAGGFNPEATLVATEDFWADFAAALAKVFTARVGSTQGNQVIIYAPRVQTSEISFGDRDEVRVFDHSMLFKRLEGNDESDWYFA